VKKEDQTAIIIPIKGLALGVHTYRITLEQHFFDRSENQEFKEAHIEAAIVLERDTSWIRLDITLNGSVLRSCDRCLGDIAVPIEYHAPVLVKFTRMHGEEDSDELIILEPTATEIDLTQYVYDSVYVSLPLQSIHPSGYCDPIMEQKISELTVN